MTEQKKLYGAAEMTDESKGRRQLKYYLTEAQDSRRNWLYGLLVEIWDGETLLEYAEAPLLTYSRELAESMLEKLMRCSVTPLCMEEVVDDLLAEC